MSAVLLYGKAAAYCKFRTLNPCLHTGRHSPTRLSQGSQSQPSTGRRAWEQLRPGLVWAGTAPRTQTPPGQAQLLQPLSRTLSHGLLHLLELGARKDLAQKDPCGFSKGEKSGRGFSCLQGCPPTPQLTVLSSHTPKLLHFPLTKQTLGNRGHQPTPRVPALPLPKCRGGIGILSCSTHCLSSLSPSTEPPQRFPPKLLMLHKAIDVT